MTTTDVASVPRELMGRRPIQASVGRLELSAPNIPGIPASEEYGPGGGRPFAPAPFAFACAPMPPTVTPALSLPEATTGPDDAIRAALHQQGLSPTQVSAFEGADGFSPLRPIATTFGAAALGELLARLRYTPAQIAAPPTTYSKQNKPPAELGPPGPRWLAPRVLLAIPGHFRELARRAPRPSEAFVLESLGWLLMARLRDEITAATRLTWWLPPPAPFVGRFPTIPIRLSPEVQALIRGPGIVDGAVTEAQTR